MTDDDDPANTAHLDTPGRDRGHFSTLEVRPASNTVDLTSRHIRFPRKHYAAPPNVAGGFKMLHLSARAPGVRANLVGSNITKDGFRIGLETWDGGVMYQAAASWIEHKKGAKECHFGQIDTLDEDVPPTKRRRQPLQRSFSGAAGDVPTVTVQPYHQQNHPTSRDYARQIEFPDGYTEPPEVVCWINRLDFGTAGGNYDNHDDNDPAAAVRAFNLKAWCSNVTPHSAKMHLSTSRETQLNGAAMCWISFPRNKRHVDSGVFCTSDELVAPPNGFASSHSKIKMTRGQVVFRHGCFFRVPTVLVALDMLEMAADGDLRINVEVYNVTRYGFEWVIETWDDSTLHAASASWIALGFA